jgi:hypothetical protein
MTRVVSQHHKKYLEINSKPAGLAINKVTYFSEIPGLRFIRTGSVTKAENFNKTATCVPAQCLVISKTPEAKLHLSVNFFSIESLIFSIKCDISVHRVHYENNINNNNNAYDSSVSCKMC